MEEEQAGTSSASSKSPLKARIKIAGLCSVVLEVELEKWNLGMLREEVGKISNSAPNSINFICAGKILKDGGDGNNNLFQLGLKNNSKIMATRSSPDHGKPLNNQFLAEEERSRRLTRIRAAAEALCKRHLDGSLPEEDFDIELENQSGKKVQLGSENDQRGIMMGLMLHANGKRLIKREKYKDALDVLSMGEEAFSLCDPKVIEMADNVPLLQIDMVWCYFMLRDMSWLSMAGVRLAKAREGIERSYGKDCSRVRLLQGDRHTELAIYLRLELLEGVVAYHSGNIELSRRSLTSAQAKFLQLQVPDEALSLLMGMGYKEKEVKRALRMSNQNVENAVNFLVEERERIALRNQENMKRRNEIMEQKKYGLTPLKKAVDLQRLNELVLIGFEKLLAAEALRRNENDTQKALDDLTNPESNALIQNYLESKKCNRPRRTSEAEIEELVSMGFERSRVINTLQAVGTKEEALSHLITGHIPNSPPPTKSSPDSASPLTNFLDSSEPQVDDLVGGPSGISGTEERDEEMEDEIAQELTGDPLADYDIDVTKEGEAIAEYLALLASGDSANSFNTTT